TGRAARIRSLGLDAAGVRTHAHGITIDPRCRTSQRHIYACGDVTGELQFTHMAEHMAKVAITNALIGLPSKIDRAGVPWVTFTDPELAHVGARRADLDRTRTRYRVYRFPFTKIDRAVAESATDGWVHVLATPRTGRILGATILGEGAGEMIAELALARKHRIPLRKIADTIHAYPTLALGNRRLADQWYVQSTSPFFVRILRILHGLHGTVPPPPERDRIV
ncbi:MAG: FAD-dependent oxidoreductase, partial [Myxococcota bacterium]|nr:FAD-dependent oxidoreductase [Myxococcota bacterium]